MYRFIERLGAVICTALLYVVPFPGWTSASFDGRLSTGLTHTCLIDASNNLSCFGDRANPYGALDVPPGKYKSVAAGVGFTCAVRVDGTLACWGSDMWGYGATNVPESSERFRYVRANAFHVCALSEDDFPRILCWGANQFQQATPPPSQVSFSNIATGSWSTCGVGMQASIPDSSPFYEGPIVCWGENNGSILGFPENLWFTNLSMGHTHGCAITNMLPGDNNTVCWGAWQEVGGHYGETVSPDGRFIEVNAGGSLSCGIRQDRSLHCWGNDQYGQLSVPGGNNYVRLSVGRGDNVCAMRSNDTTICWGLNRHGEAPRPSLVPTSLANATVGAGYGVGFSMHDGTNTDTGWGYASEDQRFFLVAGDIPPGTQFSEAGGVGGIPTVAGDFSFTVRGVDSNGFEAFRDYTISVASESASTPTPQNGSQPLIPPRLGGASGQPQTSGIGAPALPLISSTDATGAGSLEAAMPVVASQPDVQDKALRITPPIVRLWLTVSRWLKEGLINLR